MWHWLKCKWTKWKVYGVKTINREGLWRVEIRQRRECEVCGRTEDEHISYSNRIEDVKEL